MKEARNLEFKERVSDSFLKTVSAFANYDGGKILFGVRDDGTTMPLADPAGACLAIENKVNDSIHPQPDYALDIGSDGVVVLTVSPGASKPYYYRSRAYRRADTSTVEADALALSRLVLEGRRLSFERLPSADQNLRFSVLEEWAKDRIGLERFDEDTLKTLNLLSPDGVYNNAGALLADGNQFPGIDMAYFGETVSIILDRAAFAGQSLLSQYESAVRIFRTHYVYEQVEGSSRVAHERIPETAFREAVANALVHRTWDIPANVRVAMDDTGIEVTSPGGLPAGITESQYLRDELSVPRNPILAGVFFRLRLIEAFGTGVRRILQAYEGSAAQPSFSVRENSIVVTLPVLSERLDLSEDERRIYDLLRVTRPRPLSELGAETGYSKSKVNVLVKRLIDRGLVAKTGAGRATKYRRLR